MQKLKRVIAYYRSNGLAHTSRKIIVKVKQAHIFRVLKNRKVGDMYSHFRHAIDDKHVEYKGYNKYESCEQAIKYIAFYLPQFHSIPENDEWWGKGFTEWTNVTRALPQYVGHHQPRRPSDLGFYDLRDRKTQLKQIKLAKNYGIYGFCYHYYWFSGRTLLDSPINAILRDKTLDFPFCINWANENWTRRWDGNESDVLLGQSYSNEDHLTFIKDISRFLQDDRYIRVEGKPLLLVYRPLLISDVKDMVDIWRKFCRETGIGEIHLVLTHSFDKTDPATIGFDAAVDFAPNNMSLKSVSREVDFINSEFSGNIYDYKSAIELAKKYDVPAYTKYRSVCPSWDNEARKTGRGTVLDGASPSLYKEWLDVVNQYTMRHNSVDNRFVFINAWNEWAEGAYLEPDQKFGHAYLDATRCALDDITKSNVNGRIVLVSHDAHPHGAQYLLLHIVRYLNKNLKFDVDVIFLDDGELIADFSVYANTECVKGWSEKKINSMLSQLYENGVRSAILNTVVSGSLAGIMKKSGIHVVSLVHEMPELISKSGHLKTARLLHKNSDLIIFPAKIVKQGFQMLMESEVKNYIIQPQGLFRKNKIFRDQAFSVSHVQLCRKLGIPESARIILNVGYGDYRKGIDLFVDIAAKVKDHMEGVFFVWVGHLDPECEFDARKKIKEYELGNQMIFTGKNFDTDLYYAGADIFALTSREDPFPSVVLEAIGSGRPVMGFDGAGGFTELISRSVGVLVSEINVATYANEIIKLLGDKKRLDEYSINALNIINQEYDFSRYVCKLVNYADACLKKVSVIIPNYNYENYIKERIQTVVAQNYPIHELIVLDDCSSDGSVETIKSELEKLNIKHKFVVNENNSGSVFEQWCRGVSLAESDYVWIAEADDLSDPDFLGQLLGSFNDKDVVMSYCESYKIDADGEVIGRDYREYVSDISETKWLTSYVNNGDDEINTVLGIKNTIPNVSSIVFKREALLSVLNENLEKIKEYKVAGDWVTYLHLLNSGKIAFNSSRLNYHRRHDSSVTLNKFDMKLLAEIVSVQKFVQKNFNPAESVVKKSSQYAQELYEQFGLDTAASPTIEDNSELKELIQLKS